MKLDEIIINAAFYEMFENVFGEDFFGVIASMRSTPRIQRLRSKDEDKLTDDEKEELMSANIELAKVMKKYTSRIAYIGNKLYKRQYTGSYEDYLAFLASCDSSDFLNPDNINAIWGKISADQKLPDSVKNA